MGCDAEGVVRVKRETDVPSSWQRRGVPPAMTLRRLSQSNVQAKKGVRRYVTYLGGRVGPSPFIPCQRWALQGQAHLPRSFLTAAVESCQGRVSGSSGELHVINRSGRVFRGSGRSVRGLGQAATDINIYYFNVK